MNDHWPVMYMLIAWVVFFGTHVGLGATGLRRHLGPPRFALVFLVIASISFIGLCATYAAVIFEGPAGFGARSPALLVVVTVGFVFMATALVAYPRSPMARLDGRAPEPRGLARITRHGFMVGATLFGLAHAAMATRATGTVFFGGFAVLAVLGSLLQDRRLLRARGPAYAEYLASTSFLPFWAVVVGRQRLVLSELSVSGLIGGLAAAWIVRTLHPHLFAAYGLPFALTLLGPAWFFTLRAIRRAPIRRPPSGLSPS